jgi:hypothetical protein
MNEILSQSKIESINLEGFYFFFKIKVNDIYHTDFFIDEKIFIYNYTLQNIIDNCGYFKNYLMRNRKLNRFIFFQYSLGFDLIFLFNIY